MTDDCDGCGTCSRVCPVGNITLESGRPVRLHHCENRLACDNWCPKRAVRGRIAKHGYHYRHPDMTAARPSRTGTGKNNLGGTLNFPPLCLSADFHAQAERL